MAIYRIRILVNCYKQFVEADPLKGVNPFSFFCISFVWAHTTVLATKFSINSLNCFHNIRRIEISYKFACKKFFTTHI